MDDCEVLINFIALCLRCRELKEAMSSRNSFYVMIDEFAFIIYLTILCLKF